MMDSLATRFVDYLKQCRYIGPDVSGSVEITERNLTDIYNTVSTNSDGAREKFIYFRPELLNRHSARSESAAI